MAWDESDNQRADENRTPGGPSLSLTDGTAQPAAARRSAGPATDGYPPAGPATHGDTPAGPGAHGDTPADADADAAGAGAAAPRRVGRGGFRYHPALDGIRALAVTAVVLFHGGIVMLPGGFLGVDAFFVLSGFLITSLLLAEQARRGRIGLLPFWGRRIRRLLPAALLVIMATVLVARFVLRADELRLLRGDALAALGYAANWRMIYRGDDYFTQTSTPSALQHTWSLGIEEQFYLIWPLVVVAAFRWGGRRRGRTVLLAVCVLGGVASAIGQALLYRAADVNRSYFGTDTRAVALLIGCSLAVVLARPGQHTGQPAGHRPMPLSGVGPPRFHPVLGAVALAAAATVGWLWTHATGAAPWLYRGGMVAGALGVAALIAHAVRSPRSPTARVLALPPLVWLGKISYGVYLWHWPLFQFLTGERTGLRGPALLAARCAATLAIATVSYLLVEQPIRRGRLPRRGSRLAPIATATAAGLAVMVVLSGTAVPRPSRLPAAAIPTVMPTPTGSGATDAAGVPPTSRPGRKPGALPRVDILGDSVAWSLGTYLPAYPQLEVAVDAVQGCGIATLPDIRYLDAPHTNYPGCTGWAARWQAAVNNHDPDVAVILLNRWELMDRQLNGAYQHVGQPAFDAYLSTELHRAVTIAGSRGARVVLLTAMYTHRSERPDGSLYDEDTPDRVNAWNTLVRAEAASSPPGTVDVLDLNARACPAGRFTWDIDGLPLRSDGLHFTPEGVQQRIAPWLLPQLLAIATGAPR